MKVNYFSPRTGENSISLLPEIMGSQNGIHIFTSSQTFSLFFNFHPFLMWYVIGKFAFLRIDIYMKGKNFDSFLSIFQKWKLLMQWNESSNWYVLNVHWNTRHQNKIQGPVYRKILVCAIPSQSWPLCEMPLWNGENLQSRTVTRASQFLKGFLYCYWVPLVLEWLKLWSSQLSLECNKVHYQINAALKNLATD